MARLHHELALSPWRHRLHHITGIIRTVSLIDAQRDYPFSFIAFQVTGFRPRGTDVDTLLGGKALVEDLVDLAELLTEAHPLPMSALVGTAMDAERIATRFKVSTKTISRWRRRGLVGCWYQTTDGGRRLLFTTRAVQCFVARNLDLVRRGASFKLMDDAERARIVRRARELAADGQTSLHSVTLQLAEETGRAIETIRYTLRRFDFENPREALFDRVESARPIEIGRVVHAAFIEGDSIESIARRVGRSEREVRELIERERINRLAATPIDYIYNDEFDSPDAERVILAAGAARDAADAGDNVLLSRVPAELPAYLQELYRTPLLGAHEERELFCRMNYLLHRAELARRRIADDPSKATSQMADEVERRLALATPVKNRLIQANLRLVVSIAKRHLSGEAAAGLFELVSDGNVALIRAVEKFDYSRGFRFSTYATWAITRSFARSVPDEYTQADRFRTGHDEFLLAAKDHRALPFPSEESEREELRACVAHGLSQLDERERCVVERHFGFGGEGETQTLDEIGRAFGISKERVRQIEIRAMRKLRAVLGERGAELLAG